MNTKSHILPILLIASLALASGCKKEKDVELGSPTPPPAGETSITGTTWTSIQSSFFANERAMSMAVVNNKILFTYVSLSSFSGTYSTTAGVEHTGQDAQTGPGLDKIQIVDGIPYGLGAMGVYGAWSYDVNASGYPWAPAVSVGTNVYSIEKISGTTVVSCGVEPYVRSSTGGAFSQMGESFNSAPGDFIIFNGNLIAGGGFTSIGSTSCKSVAMWNGSEWVPLGSGLTGTVYDLEVYNGKLIAVGTFTSNGDGNTDCRYVAQWDGTAWMPLGNGLVGGNNGARKAYAFGTQLFIGGDFDSADGAFSPNIIKWNGSSWAALAGGAPDIIGEICVYNNHLYVANAFEISGGNFLLRLD